MVQAFPARPRAGLRYAARMDRREFLGAGAVFGLVLLSRPAWGNDSANSSQGSGDSSAGSGDSSRASGNSSAGSGDSTHNSANSSNSGDSSAESSGEAANGAGIALLSTTVVALGMSLTAGAIVLIVVLVKNGRRKRRESQELLRSALLGVRHDLGAVLALASASPSALDGLVAEAAAGEGEALDTLARATGLARRRVADAVLGVWTPVRTELDAARFALRLLDDLAPDLEPHPDPVAGWLDQLGHEARLPTPITAPAHLQLATWMGVEGGDLAPVVRATVGGRRDAHADPLGEADRLADAIAAAYPAQVQARLAALEARVRDIDAGLGAGLLA